MSICLEYNQTASDVVTLFLGCAIAAEGIYPALIGSDIGCGIALYHLSSSAHRARQNPKKIAASLQGLDDPWTGSVEQWLANYGIERSSDFDRSSLGTVGAGNHFAEICTPEDIIDPDSCEALNVKQGGLYVWGKFVIKNNCTQNTYTGLFFRS